jgi:hypothetical protein
MQVTKRPDSHTVNHLLASANPADRAKAAEGWLNANQELAQVFHLQMPGTTATEKISLVQEALGDAAQDYQSAISWAATNDPELAPRLTPGAKGFPSFDQFARLYVRKHVLGSSLELNNAGGGQAPVITLPADVAEIIANEAITSGVSPDEIINQRIAGAKSPAEAVWKLDGILGNAASQNLDEPYTTGSKLAEHFWDAQPADDSTRVGRLKTRLGETTQSRLRGGDPLEGPNASLPVAIKFGTQFKGIDQLDQESANQLLDIYVNEDIARYNEKTGKRHPLAKSSFKPNKVIENEITYWKNVQSKNAELFRDGKLTEEQNLPIQENAKQKIQQLKGQQQSIDSLRAEGEQLISASNRSTANGLGRGYVLDLDPRSGNAIAVPDFSVTPTSLDLPSGESDLGDLATQDLKNEVARQQSLNTAEPAAIDIAAAPGSDTARQYGARVESMSPGEAEPLLQKIRNLQSDRDRASAPDSTVPLSTPKHAFNTAKAHLIRKATLQPTAVGNGVNEQTLTAARNQHLASYITSIATAAHDRAGRQTRGWTGGDSYQGGARLAGPAKNNPAAYVPPSPALQQMLARTALRRVAS